MQADFDGRVDIPIGCWGEVKRLPSQWEGGRKIGEGGGERKIIPRPHLLRHFILALVLSVSSESKMAAKHSKDENHQNRLHCRLIFIMFKVRHKRLGDWQATHVDY